ncbi:hypothetical protein CR513_33558, partial [Mucuna pruriens]
MERKNRSIPNIAKYMLKVKSMPKEFWVEVVSRVLYLSNHSPTRNVKVKHLKKHGVESKLDDRNVKHVFIGCDANPKRLQVNLMNKRHEIGRKNKILMISFHILKKPIKKFFLLYLHHQTPLIHEASSFKEINL